MENAFGILVSRFRILLSKMKQRPKVVRDIVLICVVLHSMVETHQGGILRATTPADYIAAIPNESAVYVPRENHRNLSSEAKHQRDLLKDYLSHVFALAGQEDTV